MLKKLKSRWKVSTLNLILIIITFAIGGSLCGYLARKLLLMTAIDKGPISIFLYIIFATLLWPICVIVISIPFGQFIFFKKYLIKIWEKLATRSTASRRNSLTTNIAIFASGAGSNAEQIINYFSSSSSIKVALIVCNKPQAGVLSIAAKYGIPSLPIERERFFNGDSYITELRKAKIDLIVLAGFLWKIPDSFIKVYPRKIINLHPALLPKYGGKGMFGHHVHEAVIAAREKESGITIHYVDELYDQGDIIFQEKCMVEDKDTAATLEQKIRLLERANYPKIIEKILTSKNKS